MAIRRFRGDQIDMDTTVFVRLRATTPCPRRPFGGFSYLAAGLLSAGVGMSGAAHAQAPVQPARAAASSAAAPAVTAQPARFEPAFEGSGYEVFDENETAPAVESARRGIAWPSIGGKRFGRGANEGTASSVAPAADAAEAEADANAAAKASTWFVDDAVSLTGWLFGHHGVSAPVSDGIPSISFAHDPCDCPTWIGQIDALMLWMGNIPSRPLYLDSATGATALDANQLMPGMSAAPRYAVIYNRDQCRSIEVNYFSIWGFEAAREVGPIVNNEGVGTLEMNNLAGLEFNEIAAARAETSAHIQSFEINLRKVEWEWVRWITGFRWVEWGQNLTVRDAGVSEEQINRVDVLGVGTLNNLYGWQWGADAMLWNNGGRLRVNGIAKAGVYYNHQALQGTQYIQLDGQGSVISDQGVAANRDTVSFFGETGITGSLAITNWLSWRAGYTLFWLEGIATPANQLSSTSVNPEFGATGSVSPFSGVFLHGVNTGLEARW